MALNTRRARPRTPYYFESKAATRAIVCFERLTLTSDKALFDKTEAGKLIQTSKCLAKGVEAWVIQRIAFGDSSCTFCRAMDDKSQDLGWIRYEGSSCPGLSDPCSIPVKFEDVPSEVRSAVIQSYLDHDGQSNWEALLASKSLSEIRDMNLNETRKLFTEHAMQERGYKDRHSYLKEVEIMAASGIGSKAIQLQCTRSEEGVSVTLMALSGEELAKLTLSSSEETVGALREAVSDALLGWITLPRIALHDGRMLADCGHAETIETILDL